MSTYLLQSPAKDGGAWHISLPNHTSQSGFRPFFPKPQASHDHRPPINPPRKKEALPITSSSGADASYRCRSPAAHRLGARPRQPRVGQKADRLDVPGLAPSCWPGVEC